MNFKYINRKQTLGISHPADYIDWALLLTIEGENTGVLVNSLNVCYLANDGHQLWESFKPDHMQRIIKWFNAGIDDLSLDFKHCYVEDTPLSKAVQSINSEARKREIFFSIIDLRQVSELGEDLSDTKLLDKMVSECGCNPLGDKWIEYEPEYGRQKLQVLFQNEGEQMTTSSANSSGNQALSNKFLACFNSSVRFYGNDAFAPATKGQYRDSVIQSKNLQTRHDIDFGLILCDDQHIGFLLLAQDYY